MDGVERTIWLRRQWCRAFGHGRKFHHFYTRRRSWSECARCGVEVTPEEMNP